jgi:DNA-binding GntR family transcriptional regulator
LLTEMDSLGVNDWLQAMGMDREFHRVIVDASGNRTLTQMYASMDSKIIACFLAVKRHLAVTPSEMTNRHASLVEALAQRDFARAELLAIDHWSDTAARFRALIPVE